MDNNNSRNFDLNQKPMDSHPQEETRSFYNCNICFDVAIEPVLTCCGHLFCWVCLYRAINYVDEDTNLNYKECPVCKGEVSENTIIPIYGNYGSERVEETVSGLKIPPRPKAHRVESIRQQVAVHAPHNLPEALRYIMTGMVEGAHNYEVELRRSSVDDAHNYEVELGRPSGSRVRFNRVSRVLSTTSLSSLSAVLNSAEWLVEELGRIISIRMSDENSWDSETHESRRRRLN